MSSQSAVFHQPQSLWPSPRKDDGCCCCCRRNKGVRPFPEFDPNYDYIEIRSKRFLRIRHVNLRNPLVSARGADTRKNSLKQEDTTSNGVDTNNVQHPNAFQVQNDETQSSTVIRHATVLDDDSSDSSSRKPFVNQTLAQNKNPGTSDTHKPQEPVNHLKPSDRTRTASSVDVKLHNQKHTQSSPPAPIPSQGLPSSGKPRNLNDTVIFFIHGVGGSSDVWQAQVDHFGQLGYQLIIPDLIGHGFSFTPRDEAAYEFNEILLDIYAVFERYCKKDNVVIGHSYGCSFAAALTRKKASQVKKLIMISGGSPTPLAPQPGLFQMPLCFLSCCRPVLLRGFKKSAFHTANVTKKHVTVDKAFDIPTYVLKYTMNGQTWSEGDAVFHSLICAETLIIHGKEDQLILEEDEQEMAETIRGSRIVVVEDASHMVMMERPDLVNRLIHDFLGGESVRQTGRHVTGRHVTARGSRRHSVTQSAMSLRSVKSIPNTDTLVSSNLR